jgi:heme-degrading monooxygenase HmoA
MKDRGHERGYLIMWEFRAKAGSEKRFEQAYGPKGVWAQFFALGEGYAGTELNQDLKDKLRYVTLDRWVSEEHYQRFRATHAQEYTAIDKECEELTDAEREIGAFARLG